MLIRKEIIPNPPFQYSRLLMVLLTEHLRIFIILNVYSIVVLGHTREATFLKPLCVCSNKRNGQIIRKQLIDSTQLMAHLLNGFHKLLWCNISSIWWYSKPNISHNSDDIFQGCTKGYF